MIFETLWESAQRSELTHIEGGFCNWHKRTDCQLTINEIISLRPGAGQDILARFKAVPGAVAIQAKCPMDLA